MEAPLKKILRALSLELRHTLEGSYKEDGTWIAGDLERRLNQIGIWRDRAVKPISEMPNLSPVDRNARELIDAYLSLRNDAGVSQSDAVAEFIRESAYSWANRLFALRCMEARGIIDPVILQEEAYHGRSMVHDRFAQTNPTQCTGEDDGLFAMLSEEFRERSKELPDLFAPDSPAVALRPSVVALKRCIALLSGTVPANGGRATDDVFSAPDAFGWAYQYWNAEDKDRVFEMVRTKKGAKIEGSDIIPATQLYTEPYMVKFLVQNSLGATWMMMHPESKISDTWEYYVKDADRTPNEEKPVAEITFLDPACGSGHFLIEAFDLLYAMYEEEGQLKEPAAICRSILNNNLFGIDIDERAVQITKAVLWMKAAETVFAKIKQQLSGDGLFEFHDHIIATNIRLPKGKDHLDTFLKKHPEDAPLRPALLTVFDGLQNVYELGSLVQIEEPVEKELKVLKEQAKQQRFDPETGEIVEKVNFARWKQQVMKRLKAHFQDEAEKALPTEAFFSLSAVKGLALFDLLARRYDVVAANPPYMGSGNMGAWLKSYVGAHYPEGKRDLYAAFIMRNLQISEKNGRVAMVTQQSWMFIRNFSDLRKKDLSLEKNEKGKFNGILLDTNIEFLVHLGPHAFEEITGEVVNNSIFVLKNIVHSKNKMFCYRLNGIKSPQEKAKLLIQNNEYSKFFIFKPDQSFFIEIPSSPICYWLDKRFFEILSNNPNLGSIAPCQNGITTYENNRFLRFFWEIQSLYPDYKKYTKGGRYQKWSGLDNQLLRWGNNGLRIKANIDKKYPYLNGNYGWALKENTFNKRGWTWTLMSSGCLGVRKLDGNTFFDSVSPAIFSDIELPNIGSILNSRVSSYLMRSITAEIKFREGYVCRLPIPINLPNTLATVENLCVKLKNDIISNDLLEISFKGKIADSSKNIENVIFVNSAFLHLFEAYLEREVIKSFILSLENEKNILSETGNPAGFYPVINNYRDLPPLPGGFPEFPAEVVAYLTSHKCIAPKDDEIVKIRKRLRSYFEEGPGSKSESEEIVTSSYPDDDSLTIGARIPIPSETFLEELSQKMEIHPISIYWLLKEGIEKEGWRCIPEEKRYTEDLFTVMVLRLLGHRWPKQIEAGEPVPEWADIDGIIPITSGLTHPTLLQQVRDRIAAEFPGGKVHEIEKEFEEVVGISLERWLAGEFFKHHISQFKKRPIAWQLSSSPSGIGAGKGKGRGSRREPAFSCLVYYHKIDADILHKIRTQYVGDLINRYGTELRALEGRKELTPDRATRKVQLENWIAELKDFSQALQDVADSGFDSPVLREIVKKESLDKWTSREGISSPPKSGEEFYAQEKRYDPDINDGVRVNIAPLQKAGLLAAEVIAKKDVEKAIADRADWRADERRWCREGKLPKCGWWD